MDQELSTKFLKALDQVRQTIELHGQGPKAKAEWIRAWSMVIAGDPTFKVPLEAIHYEIELISLRTESADPSLISKIIEYISLKSSGMNLTDYFKQSPWLIVTRNAPFDKEYYDYFFASKISLCPEKNIYELLSYQFKNYFNSDRPAFRNFLEYAILKDHGSLLDKAKAKIIHEFCDDYLTRKKASALSARQHAIILYFNVLSQEHEELVPKGKKLQEHAKSLRIGAPSFVQIYYAVEKDFLKRKLSLAKEIDLIHPLLKGKSIDEANRIIKELNELSALPRRTKSK